MTPEELKTICRQLYGYGWQTKLAKELGVNGSTVRRWVSGKVKIPSVVVKVLNLLMEKS